jgi:NADPH2:quinone reductase
MVSGGRLCYVAADGGRDLNLDVFDISLRSISITGVNLRHRKVAEKGRIADILRARIWPQIEQGRIRPVVGTVRPLAEAVDAHALLAAG